MGLNISVGKCSVCISDKSTGNYFCVFLLRRTAVSGAPGMVLPGYHANLAMHAYPYMLAGQYMMPQVC